MPCCHETSLHDIHYFVGAIFYLAAVLEEAGHEVSVIDCPAEMIDLKQLKTKLASIAPNLIGITSMTPTIQSAFQSAQAAPHPFLCCPERSAYQPA